VSINKKINNIIYLITILLLINGLLVLLSAINIPFLPRVMVVRTGSMTPKIPVGSAIFSRETSSYKYNDIITYISQDIVNGQPREDYITHRIVDINIDGTFITKGDANNTADFDPVKKENVVGKVVFTIPYIGYVINFAKTKEGLILLVIIPATLIIYSEIITIKNETVKLLAQRKKRKHTIAEKEDVETGNDESKLEKGVESIFKKK